MDRSELAVAFRTQADWCRQLGSPLYYDLLERAAADIESGGRCWTLLEPYAGGQVLALRLMGGIHRLVLEGQAPDLARYYPSAGGTHAADLCAANPNDLWLAFLEAAFRAKIPEVLQTNEVGRCLGLLPGFIAIARATHLPLRLLEVGASGGLNLRWDRYRFATEAGIWGDPHSPVQFQAPFNPGPLPPTPTVVERRGCDLNPLDISNKSGELTLLSCIWPDQSARLELVRQAIGVARRFAARVEKADALDWIAKELAQPVPGTATVVFHSIVMMYLEAERRARFAEILAEAGARATHETPLAWLSMERAEEPSGSHTSIDLTLWPGGTRRRIAGAGFHGQEVILNFPGTGAPPPVSLSQVE